MGEQSNPWQLLHRQDALSRHRGAKPRRRYGRSGAISLFTIYIVSEIFISALTISSSATTSSQKMLAEYGV